MNRRTIHVFCGLGLVVACQGGGSPNDFGLGPSDNAPTDPGAPGDPGEPPGNPNDPPGNPNDPPFGGGSVPGSSVDCTSVCNEVHALCPDEDDDVAECIEDCRTEVPAQCLELAIAFVRCVARNGCTLQDPRPQVDPNEEIPIVCEAELVAYANCLGPEPPDGEGGAGGI